MTEKEKAEDLFATYRLAMAHPQAPFGIYKDDIAKQCALLTIDEIIDAIDWHEYEVPNDQLKFWFNVKQEIEKL